MIFLSGSCFLALVKGWNLRIRLLLLGNTAAAVGVLRHRRGGGESGRQPRPGCTRAAPGTAWPAGPAVGGAWCRAVGGRTGGSAPGNTPSRPSR